MEAEFNHLNHATWACKYHVVFAPKYRKKLLFGKIKRHLGPSVSRSGATEGVVPVGNLIRLATEAESRDVSVL